MNENKKELISKNTSLAPLSTGLASRGLQVARQLAQRSYQEFTNSIGMKLIRIPKGTFTMGSPIDEDDEDDAIECDDEQHVVTISKDYYLSLKLVTQVQYEKVMGTNPSFFQGNEVQGDSSNHPVEMVSWDNAVEFCKRLSELTEEKKAGRVYRLPTEAEWEHACRAGSKTAYCFGDDSRSLGDYAWFRANSKEQTHPVGKKKANAWGLYDMHGNVWEWCCDRYGEYPKGEVSDPSGPKEGSLRVYRGGCWDSIAAYCLSASRSWYYPSSRCSLLGFRVALSPSGIRQSPEADK